MKFSRVTSVLTLTLSAALAACDSPTSIAEPLARRVVSASANGGKPEVELCQAHWRELKTWGGESFQNLGDCIKYSATGGIYEGTPLILFWTTSAAYCTITEGLYLQITINFINGSGVIDYGTGPLPYNANDPFYVSAASPPLVTLTVTNAIGQVATAQFTPSWYTSSCG